MLDMLPPRPIRPISSQNCVRSIAERLSSSALIPLAEARAKIEARAKERCHRLIEVSHYPNRRAAGFGLGGAPGFERRAHRSATGFVKTNSRSQTAHRVQSALSVQPYRKTL
jgi:hypothetical protein